MTSKPTHTDMVQIKDLKNLTEQNRNLKDIPAKLKREIIRKQSAFTVNVLSEQLDMALAFEKDKLANQQVVMLQQTSVNTSVMILELRDQFVNSMATLGHTVEINQLEFLLRFAESLANFRKALAKADIDETEKSEILAQSHKAFTRTKNKLDKLTDDLIEETEKQANF
jgi:hypothetical protein